MRFVIDAVPAVDEMTETEVLSDATTNWGANKIALIDVSGVLVDAIGRASSAQVRTRSAALPSRWSARKRMTRSRPSSSASIHPAEPSRLPM